jgi:RNA polymerase sigma factor (sigma-70 family)
VSKCAESFADFYKNHFFPVVRSLRVAGAEAVEAEDATQSAMETLWRRWKQVNDVLEPCPWVHVVARNNWLRAKRRELCVPCGSPADLSPADARSQVGGDPQESVGGLVGKEEALQVFQVLPRAQREVLALIFDGYGPSEIARMTGKPSVVVRSNLAHARRRLRQVADRTTSDTRLAS